MTRPALALAPPVPATNPSIVRGLSEAQFAERLGLSKSAVRKLREKEGIPHYRFGRRVVYRLSDVEAWEASHRIEGSR